MTRKRIFLLSAVLCGLLVGSPVFSQSCDVIWEDTARKQWDNPSGYLEDMRKNNALGDGSLPYFPVINLGRKLIEHAQKYCPDRVGGLTAEEVTDRFLKANGHPEGILWYKTGRMHFSDLQKNYIRKSGGIKTGLPTMAEKVQLLERSVEKQRSADQSQVASLQKQLVLMEKKVRKAMAQVGNKDQTFAELKREIDTIAQAQAALASGTVPDALLTSLREQLTDPLADRMKTLQDADKKQLEILSTITEEVSRFQQSVKKADRKAGDAWSKADQAQREVSGLKAIAVPFWYDFVASRNEKLADSLLAHRAWLYVSLSLLFAGLFILWPQLRQGSINRSMRKDINSHDRMLSNEETGLKAVNEYVQTALKSNTALRTKLSLLEERVAQIEAVTRKGLAAKAANAA